MVLHEVLLVADATTSSSGLNAAGLTVMVVSIGSVLSLVSYCLYRVLSLPPVEVEEHIKGPLEIEPGGSEDAD